MLRRIYTLFFLAIAAISSFTALAQQPTQFSQFQLNQLYFNPAAAGADGGTRLQVIHRTQYAGYQGTFDAGGAPSTQLFSGSTVIKNFGVGFTAFNDKIGPWSNQSFQLAGAYRFAMSNGNLAVGASAGLYRSAIDYNVLRARDDGDPIIGTGVVGEIHPDVNLGVRYEAAGYYVGASVNHLLNAKYKLGSDLATNPLIPVYYLNGGLNLEIGYLWEVQPFAIAKSDLSSPIAIEGGVMGTYNQRYWAGISYRAQDALIFMGGVNLMQNQSLRLSGAYDLVIGAPSLKTPTSYEVMLSYRLPAPKFGKKTIVRTPRFRF
ncbi:type IX secretion system membrane protein PorP/SprF [Persicitalea sp.]|uniref:PorP/SprF family type IX secretion system membrane protein n=1 Tax=Persicitalea sp. TaxID=3100273 RepID=UPI0035945F66